MSTFSELTAVVAVGGFRGRVGRHSRGANSARIAMLMERMRDIMDKAGKKACYKSDRRCAEVARIEL